MAIASFETRTHLVVFQTNGSSQCIFCALNVAGNGVAVAVNTTVPDFQTRQLRASFGVAHVTCSQGIFGIEAVQVALDIFQSVAGNIGGTAQG